MSFLLGDDKELNLFESNETVIDANIELKILEAVSMLFEDTDMGTDDEADDDEDLDDDANAVFDELEESADFSLTEATMKRHKNSIMRQRATMIALMLSKGASDPLYAKMTKNRELYRGFRSDILKKYGAKALSLARQKQA